MLLQDRMNRLFEDATRRRRTRVDAEKSDDIETAEWYPAADVYDNEGEYLIAVDLPGIDRSALEITIDDNQLTIKGTRTIAETSTARTERPTGRFLRTFSVPGSVDQTTFTPLTRTVYWKFACRNVRRKWRSALRSRYLNWEASTNKVSFGVGEEQDYMDYFISQGTEIPERDENAESELRVTDRRRRFLEDDANSGASCNCR